MKTRQELEKELAAAYRQRQRQLDAKLTLPPTFLEGARPRPCAYYDASLAAELALDVALIKLARASERPISAMEAEALSVQFYLDVQLERIAKPYAEELRERLRR